MGIIWNNLNFSFMGVKDPNSWFWLLSAPVTAIIGAIITIFLTAIFWPLAILGFLLTIALFLWPFGRFERRLIELRGGKPRDLDFNTFTQYYILHIAMFLANLSCWFDKKFAVFLVGGIVLFFAGLGMKSPYIMIAGFLALVPWIFGALYHTLRTQYSPVIFLTGNFTPMESLEKSWKFMDKNVIDWFGTYHGTATILSIPLNIVYTIYWVYLLSRNPLMFLGASAQPSYDSPLFLVIFGLVFAAYFIGLMCVWLNLFYIIGNTTRNQKEETIKLAYLD